MWPNSADLSRWGTVGVVEWVNIIGLLCSVYAGNSSKRMPDKTFSCALETSEFPLLMKI